MGVQKKDKKRGWPYKGIVYRRGVFWENLDIFMENLLVKMDIELCETIIRNSETNYAHCV